MTAIIYKREYFFNKTKHDGKFKSFRININCLLEPFDQAAEFKTVMNLLYQSG